MMTTQDDEHLTIDEINAAEEQIREMQKTVDYDTKEYTVGYLIHEFSSDQFYIPEYQRKFVWDDHRKSKFIESIVLGLPIPYMFVADMDDGRFEIVDGAQRIRTLQQFLSNDLRLKGLEKLDQLNGFCYNDLPVAQQRKFKGRSLRMVSLSDKTDEETRRDLFERINTGSDELKHAELRKGAYSGPFYKLVQECASDPLFLQLCPMRKQLRDRGEGEELVLRFFAYSDQYQLFRHSVRDFLNTYLKEKNQSFDEVEAKQRFARMLDFVNKYFASGFRKTENSTTTPRVRFEAISVGIHLALLQKPDLIPHDVSCWLESDEFKRHTRTDASNSGPKLRARIEFVRDSLLSGENGA